MLKVLLAFLIILDLGILILLIIAIIASINAGGGNVFFPGLGVVVSLPFLLGLVFIFEIFLVGISTILYRFIKKRSGKLV